MKFLAGMLASGVVIVVLVHLGLVAAIAGRFMHCGDDGSSNAFSRRRLR
jgi:hypothetical protein